MIDSHAHVASELFDSDRDEVVSRMLEQGCTGWIEVGTNIVESEKAVALAQKHSNVYASVGVHPDYVRDMQEKDWTVLRMLVMNQKVCAIGELGFDTFRDGTIAEQEPVLRKFIDLALAHNKPVIFHVRNKSAGKTPGVIGETPGVEEADAHEELLRVLSSYPLPGALKGVIHTFSGTQEQAQRYIDLGMMISFSGVITFKNAGELSTIANNIPLSSIIVETDCPFLTPEPFRGQRNEPAYVRYVVQKIADIRGVSFEEIEKATEENTKKLFDIDFL